MGMVVVAFFASNVGPSPVVTIRSTLRRTNSAASSGRRPGFCSANLYTKAIFFPSIQPSLLSSCRNASTRTALPAAVLGSRKPMRKIFPGCCASTVCGLARMLPPTMVTNALRSISLYSPDELVGSCQDRLRDGQPERLGGFEVDDELEFGGLLDGEVTRLRAVQNLRDVPSRTPEYIGGARAV